MTADLALLAADPSVLDVLDDPGKQIELACQRANAWLKVAVRDVRIETIVETKAQAAALAAFAVQKQLGKDAELAALEVQRRAERGVGLAIRRGQESGEIRRHGQRPVHGQTKDCAASPLDFAAQHELSDRNGGIYDVTDGVTDEAFEEAIEGAKAEGNLSRANVVRKVKEEKNGALTTAQKVDRIRELAGKGWATAQIARELGHSEDWIARLAKQHSIDVHADKALSRSRRIDSSKVAAEIVATLDGLTLPMRAGGKSRSMRSPREVVIPDACDTHAGALPKPRPDLARRVERESGTYDRKRVRVPANFVAARSKVGCLGCRAEVLRKLRSGSQTVPLFAAIGLPFVLRPANGANDSFGRSERAALLRQGAVSPDRPFSGRSHG